MKILLFSAFILLIIGCSEHLKREYIIAEKDLVPEGIAYSKAKKSFYLSSVGKSKIVKINRKTGVQEDFIDEHEFGYSPGVGVYVDEDRNRLYAIGGYYTNSDSLSSLFEFDLDTGELVDRYDVSGDHFLNDMIMDDNGNMYLTDSKDSSVFILKKDNKDLELFFKSTEIQYPNGIAISADNTKLYVATFMKGVRVLDIQSKLVLNEADTTGVSGGIDGLEYYNGSLYAIQNGVRKNTDNFRKLILNEGEDDIVGVEVIDSHNPDLNVPLTFCIAGEQAVVIANSGLQYLDQETYIFPDSDTIANAKLKVYDLSAY